MVIGDKNLNIITLNVPYPPDYGGMIDTFYRIKALSGIGVRINLHCFEYGRTHQAEIYKYCDSVHYYPRNRGMVNQMTLLPYIVSSRRSEELERNLLKNDYPVLFDGLHTTFLLDHPVLAGRSKIVRAHNIEHLYYRKLARFETNILRKIYYLTEAARLARYENIINRADLVLPVSMTELEYFRNKYRKTALLSPFHPYDEPECIPGSGDYILFHGDMSVNENAVIAYFLTTKVFSRISYPCIIAGKGIPRSIFKAASGFTNIRLITNPDQGTIKEILLNAHIHVLPALESNGFRIKLLMALFGGRHCIANSMILAGTMLTSLCHVADTPSEILCKINSLMHQPFTASMINQRRELLTEHYNNKKNAEKLAGLIFSVNGSR